MHKDCKELRLKKTEGPQFRWDCSSPSPSLGLGELKTGFDCFNPNKSYVAVTITVKMVIRSA